jgi:hypothetical protein
MSEEFKLIHLGVKHCKIDINVQIKAHQHTILQYVLTMFVGPHWLTVGKTSNAVAGN